MTPLENDFERCWPWLCASIERYGHTHEKHHIFDDINNARAVFFPGERCALVGRWIEHPTGLKSANAWLVGGDYDEIKRLVPYWERYSEERGAHQVTVFGRRGWARLPGYEECGWRIIKTLRRF